ncbi:MAG: T9SS type A sorting domain-containing protein, partial [Candidatus Cloacimonetes bacterium]|nr:T9SS type A sorting domain-containing protein [Candidatus Cloacimonadota bacterium]
DMLDSDGDGDNSLEDYYLVFVKSVDEIVWTRLHYNFNGPGSGGVASVWTLINQEYANDTFGWQSGTCDISDWAGETVQIKFQVLTDNNNDGGTGAGLFIDDFRVYNTVFQGPAPENLIATALPDNTVQLTWDPAQIGGGEGWIGWDSGVLEGYLGLTEPSEWDVASRFTASDMMPYVNGELTTVKFMPGSSLTSSYDVRVWTGSMAAALVAEVPIEDPVPEDWNEVILPEPVLIELGEELWIGYHIDQVDPADPGGYSAGYDPGPSVAGLYYNPGTGWSNLSGDFDNNWLIQGYIEAADGRVFEFAPYQNQTRELENYNVWHSSTSEGPYDLLDSVEIMDEPTYIHTTPAGGAFNYYVVTAVYDGFDSGYSNEASAYVLDYESTLLYYDDGEAESGYNVGQGRHMAVKFTPDYDRLREPVTVTHIVLYVHEVNVGNTIFRIYNDDGDGGLPGPAFISQFAITGSLVDGWNTIPIPESEQQEFSEGSFYLAILEITNPSVIGLDSNSFSNSYTDESGTWELFTDGNFMMRAIVDPNPGSGAGEEITPIPEISISNYPNPFNPETTINLYLPFAGQAELKIYNVKGELVNALLDGYLEAGSTTIIWDGSDSNGKLVSSGLYMYTLETKKQTVSKKMILLK